MESDVIYQHHLLVTVHVHVLDEHSGGKKRVRR